MKLCASQNSRLTLNSYRKSNSLFITPSPVMAFQDDGWESENSFNEVSIENGNKPIIKDSRFKTGVNIQYPTGKWPSTALTNGGSSAQLKQQGHQVHSSALGLNFQYQVHPHFVIFMDANIYNYNIQIGNKDQGAQSSWTIAEGLKHMDEPDAPQSNSIYKLPSDVYFDMLTAGLRMGVKYYISTNKVKPWIGAGIGYYGWQVNYSNPDGARTFGKDDGSLVAFTFLTGLDCRISKELTISLFIDMHSPMVTYNINGLFYKQWNIVSQAPIMGNNRFGIALLF